MSNVALTDTTVELSVSNFEKTKAFYQKLGFEIIWEESPKAMNGYMVMKLGKSILCFFCGNNEVYKHPYFKQYLNDTKRGYGVEISIPVENIDDYYSKVIKRIPEEEIFQPLKEQPWGKKDFRIEDPFGYFLRFNEPWNVLEYLPLESDYKS
jgi:predicted lactoylglutathione lyase